MMISLLFYALIQLTASQQPFEYKSASLTPLRTYVIVSILSIDSSTHLNDYYSFNNGARVMQSTADVQNVRYGNQFKWNIQAQTQRGWHFIMSLDDSFGFDPLSKSAITITLNGPSQSINIDEFLFGLFSNAFYTTYTNTHCCYAPQELLLYPLVLNANTFLSKSQ